jgi:monothiol glutaredoxin
MDNSVAERIKSDIESNDVVLYMKGTPVFPQCGFSSTVVQVLTHLGVKFKGVDVLTDPSIREGIKQFSNWPTIPQLYVKGEFLGGCDIVREMYQTGELQELLERKGLRLRSPFCIIHHLSYCLSCPIVKRSVMLSEQSQSLR